MTTQTAFNLEPHFNGTGYKPRDHARLAKQHEVIRDWMLRHGGWRTLGEIEDATGYPQASISAQLRHLRKERFGGYIVIKRRREAGLWEYKVTR